MGLFSKDIKTMDDLFVHTLQDIYYAENQITKALPQMIDKATDPQLKQGFQTHLTETQNQIKRLEQVFQHARPDAKGVDCPAIDGIIEEAERGRRRRRGQGGARRGPPGLGAGRRALRDHPLRHADRLGEAARPQRLRRLLQQNLEEEKATDKKLTAIAESRVNRKAA